MADKLDSGEKSLDYLFSGATELTIPKFQRRYSWRKKQAQELWNDLLQYTEEKKYDSDAKYIFGQIIVYRNEGSNAIDKNNYIIDGQQRLTTVLLMVAATRFLTKIVYDGQEIDKDEYARIVTPISNRIKYKDRVRIYTNEENSKLIDDLCVNGYTTKPQGDDSASQNKMITVYLFFLESICEKIGLPGTIEEKINLLKGKTEYAEMILSFVETLLSFKVYFISTSNLHDAYRVFDRTNTRGLKLSNVDLIRSHIFSNCYRNDETLNADRYKIESTLNNILYTFDLNAEEMFRYYYISKHGNISNDKLYDQTKKLLKDEKHIKIYIDDLNESLKLYQTMYGNSNHFEEKTSINITLKRLKYANFKIFYPIVLAAYLRMEKTITKDNKLVYDSNELSKFSDLIDAIETLYIRNIVICKESSNQFDNKFGEYAKIISDSDKLLIGVQKIINEIYSLCKSDNEITNLLKIDNGWKRKSARIFMTSMYNRTNRITQIVGNEVDMEHIMPEQKNYEKFEKKWPGISEEDKNDNLYKIGNIVIWEKGENRSNKDDPFSKKRENYRELNIINVDNGYLMKQKKWGPDQIKERTRIIAKLAPTTWPITMGEEIFDQ